MAYAFVKTIFHLLVFIFLIGCGNNSQIRSSDKINSVASPTVQFDVMIMIGVHEKIYTGDKRPILVAAKPVRKEGRTFVELWTVESAGNNVDYRVTLEIDFIGTRYSLTRLTQTTTTTTREKAPVNKEPPVDPENKKIISVNQYRSLLEGKTLSGEHITKGFKFKNYFAPDGSLTEVRDNGKIKNGQWSISDTGYLCIIWKNKEGCGHLSLNEDGSILFSRNDKQIRRFTQFADGKRLE